MKSHTPKNTASLEKETIKKIHKKINILPPSEEEIEEMVQKWKEHLESDQFKYNPKCFSEFIFPWLFNKIKIEEFHIGFQYEELQMDKERYFNKGMIWVRKTYGFKSPRLWKMKKRIDAGKIRRVKH